MYHVKTSLNNEMSASVYDGRNNCSKSWKLRLILLCPNFLGSLLAPTTANCGEEKNIFAAVSVAMIEKHD